MRRFSVPLVIVCGCALASGAAADRASARASTIPKQWKNCTEVHKHYRHGVGRANAHDKTSGTPVTNFKHSTKIYGVAMSYNRGLDRDNDGIACEQ